VGRFLAVTGMVLLALRFLTGESSHWNYRSAGEAIFLGATTAVAYGLWDRAMRQGKMLLVAVCSYFTPLLSTLVSCTYLHVPVSSKLLWGSTLLVAGSLLSWSSIRTEPRAPTASTRG
jgi:drug/metabolite transporter (DMT)-like permease